MQPAVHVHIYYFKHNYVRLGERHMHVTVTSAISLYYGRTSVGSRTYCACDGPIGTAYMIYAKKHCMLLLIVILFFKISGKISVKIYAPFS